MADLLVEVDGVRAVLLGGSRARGNHAADADFDLGLYYEPPLDVAALQSLARSVAGLKPGSPNPAPEARGWMGVPG